MLRTHLQEVLLELLRQLKLSFLVLSCPVARACPRHNQLVAILGAAAESARCSMVTCQQCRTVPRHAQMATAAAMLYHPSHDLLQL